MLPYDLFDAMSNKILKRISNEDKKTNFKKSMIVLLYSYVFIDGKFRVPIRKKTFNRMRKTLSSKELPI